MNIDNHSSLTTPILFLIYNRLEPTVQVFEAIRRARPRVLLVAGDGAKHSRHGDNEKCEQVRNYVLSHIDWPCKVETHFQRTNAGCKLAVSEAITWTFERFDRAIILEDDCLPNSSFFSYSEEMLEKYACDQRVMMISGTNYIGDNDDSEESYFFSKYFAIWGWATWRRAWKNYDVSMREWPGWKEERS